LGINHILFESRYIPLKKVVYMLCIMSCFSFTAFAQKAVNGIVTDTNGEAIIGANVVEKGTANDTVTDVNGNFSLTVADGALLEVSYIAYVTQKIKIEESSVLHIVLAEDSQLLEEIVVIDTPQKKTEGKNLSNTEIHFSPIKTNGLVFTKQNDRNVPLQKIKTHELVKPTYNLRIAKDSEIVRIFIDGKPVYEVRESFGASQVGLLTDKADYITLFHTKK